MAGDDRLHLVRDVYRAFAAADREAIERAFADDFTFSSPLDVGLDRAGYFERCWPGAGRGQEFEFVRLIQSDDEVVVTYEMRHGDGRKGRNTEVLTFDQERICRVEVYFGWNVD
jgi:SnoaL-like domain